MFTASLNFALHHQTILLTVFLTCVCFSIYVGCGSNKYAQAFQILSDR